MTNALEGVERSASGLGHVLPLGKTRYPLYRRLGGPQGRSGQVRKILPVPELVPRTVQPIASRYTYYATRPTVDVLLNTLRTGSFKMFKRPFPEFLTILTL